MYRATAINSTRLLSIDIHTPTQSFQEMPLARWRYPSNCEIRLQANETLLEHMKDLEHGRKKHDIGECLAR